MKTQEKAQAGELENAQKDCNKLEGLTFNCQENAETALQQFNKNRLMVLWMVMGLYLLFYSLADRKLRQALKLMNSTHPRPKT